MVGKRGGNYFHYAYIRHACLFHCTLVKFQSEAASTAPPCLLCSPAPPSCRPIKFLRIVVATFFMVFYIGSLTIFMVALSCNWFVDDPLLQFHVHAFPEVGGCLLSIAILAA